MRTVRSDMLSRRLENKNKHSPYSPRRTTLTRWSFPKWSYLCVRPFGGMRAILDDLWLMGWVFSLTMWFRAEQYAVSVHHFVVICVNLRHSERLIWMFAMRPIMGQSRWLRVSVANWFALMLDWNMFIQSDFSFGIFLSASVLRYSFGLFARCNYPMQIYGWHNLIKIHAADGRTKKPTRFWRDVRMCVTPVNVQTHSTPECALPTQYVSPTPQVTYSRPHVLKHSPLRLLTPQPRMPKQQRVC